MYRTIKTKKMKKQFIYRGVEGSFDISLNNAGERKIGGNRYHRLIVSLKQYQFNEQYFVLIDSNLEGRMMFIEDLIHGQIDYLLNMKGEGPLINLYQHEEILKSLGYKK